MSPDDILLDRCYRTKSGTLCRVNAFTDEDEVVFIPYVNEQPGDPDQMPRRFFAANVEEEVPLPRTG
jgi:hypothetical protein